MIHGLRHKLLCVSLLAMASAVAAQAQNYTKPKVRAITGFVRLDRANYAPQIAETLAVYARRSVNSKSRLRGRNNTHSDSAARGTRERAV